jgi:hypothetical protein
LAKKYITVRWRSLDFPGEIGGLQIIND